MARRFQRPRFLNLGAYGPRPEATRARVPRLLVIVDVDTCNDNGVEPLAMVGLAVEAKAPALLLRHKSASADAMQALAAEAARFCVADTCSLVISGDATVALAVGASGVHLPAAKIDEARAARSAGLLVGASVHDHAELQRAIKAGADYVTFSPVFRSASKPDYGPPAGLDGLASIVRAAGEVRVLALGGVTVDRVQGARAAGAWGVAAMGPFCQHGVGRAVADYRRALKTA